MRTAPIVVPALIAGMLITGCNPAQERRANAAMDRSRQWVSNVFNGNQPPAHPYAGQNLTPAQEELRESGDAYNKTVIEGTVLGAVVGAGVGYAVSRDAKGAAAGGVIGGALGNVAGHHVANKQRDYATKEERLDAVIGEAKERNEKLAKHVDAMERVVRENRAKLTELKMQLKRKKITKDQYRARLGSLAQDEEVMKHTLTQAKADQKKLQDERKNLTGSDQQTRDRRASLDAELDQLKQLTKRTETAYKEISPSPVG
jgi:uncharacterized protein YcfJ